MNDKQKQWFSKIPKVYQANYETAISGSSRAAAVKAKCLDCTNWQRAEISCCPVDTCPLWPYKPFRISENLKNPQKSGTLEQKMVKGCN
jgi:hypothetical protein